jgi:hypothetical protein
VNVIARRVLQLHDDDGNAVRDVVVSIGQPFMDPEALGEWACPYQIDGLGGWDGQYRIVGEDAVQALQLVHGVIWGVLTGCDEADRLRLWGMPQLGFPSPFQRVKVRHEVLENSAYISFCGVFDEDGRAVDQLEIDDENGELAAVLDFAYSGELVGLELFNAGVRLPEGLRTADPIVRGWPKP